MIGMSERYTPTLSGSSGSAILHTAADYAEEE
jgi:hypothetical protein